MSSANAQLLQARERIQTLAKRFHQEVSSDPLWTVAKQKGLIDIPQTNGWEDRPLFTQIITIHTRDKYTWWLYYQLLSSAFCVYPVHHPVVPVGRSRIRVTLHAANTEEQIEKLVHTVFHWVQEVMDIEEGRVAEKAPGAATTVYAWMKKEGLSGFGFVQT